MAVDYATLKKGGFMRQKQKNNFSGRIRLDLKSKLRAYPLCLSDRLFLTL